MRVFESQTPLVQGTGRQLAAKLKAYLRPKCQAALLDPAVNTPATVRLNIFQARGPCASVQGKRLCNVSSVLTQLTR